MNIHLTYDAPKAPRWITTEAGHWAWAFDVEWRKYAEQALGVAERRELLDQAEVMRNAKTQSV